MKRLLALLMLTMIATATGFAQARPAQVPQSDVTFQTVSMRYPFDKVIKVPLVGTQRFASNINGEASVERRSSVTLLSVKINRLPRPSTVGPMSSTYVIWAITPEGIADNLGEFRKRPSDTFDGWFGSEIRTSTRHRNFSLIVTAEPHYLVASPSRLVVVVNKEVLEPRVVVTDNTISFNGDADVENKIVSPDPPSAKDPNYPVELVEARRAIDIARYYDADTYAPKLVADASAAFDQAEASYKADKRDEAAETADTAIRLAERARRISAGRKAAERDRQRVAAKDDVISDLETRNSQIPVLQTQLERERTQRREAESENARGRDDYNRILAEKSKIETNNETLLAENKRLRADLDAMQTKAKETELRVVRDQLAREFEDARFEPRGSVLVMPDSYFIPASGSQPASLTAAAISKLDRLVEFLRLSSTTIRVESYTDSSGTEQSRSDFCRERGQLVLSYLTSRGIPVERIQAFSMGNASPRQPNTTPKGRTANRRVELILPPDGQTAASSGQ